jgi:hypothetical protein
VIKNKCMPNPVILDYRYRKIIKKMKMVGIGWEEFNYFSVVVRYAKAKIQALRCLIMMLLWI